MKKLIILVLSILSILTLTSCTKKVVTLEKNAALNLREHVISDLKNIDYLTISKSTMRFDVNASISTKIDFAGSKQDVKVDIMLQNYVNISSYKDAFLFSNGTIKISKMIDMTIKFSVYYIDRSLYISVDPIDGIAEGLKIKLNAPLSNTDFISINENLNIVAEFLTNDGIVQMLVRKYNVGENGIDKIFTTFVDVNDLEKIIVGENLLQESFSDFLLTPIPLDFITSELGIEIADVLKEIRLVNGSFLTGLEAEAKFTYNGSLLKNISIKIHAYPFEPTGLNLTPVETTLTLNFDTKVPKPVFPSFDDYILVEYTK